MFLTARLVGIFTYIVVLFMTLAAVRYVSERQTKYILWGYLAALCAMAYFYVPYITTDLYRHIPYAKYLAQMSWREFFFLFFSHKAGLFTLIYFRFFAPCLSTVTCAVVFGSMFYILWNSSKKIQVSRSVLMLALLWLMTNDFYLIAISNIRSYVAVAFVTFCIYRETFEHKFGLLNILLYVCAVEMHAMGIVLVGFRTLGYLVSSGKMSAWKFILIPMILLALVFGIPLYQNLLVDSTDKFEDYYTRGHYNYIWERVIFSIQILVQGYILFKAYMCRLFKEEMFAPYKVVVTMGFIVLFVCQIHVTFMQRWIIFSAILEVPVLLRLLQLEREQGRHQAMQFLITTSLITFAFVCSRGNLCSLKFWE